MEKSILRWALGLLLAAFAAGAAIAAAKLGGLFGAAAPFHSGAQGGGAQVQGGSVGTHNMANPAQQQIHVDAAEKALDHGGSAPAPSHGMGIHRRVI